MSYLVLARKWRPQIFEEVIGQRHVVKTLQNAVTSNRISHAFLFTGQRGIGKTSIARILAKALNCQEGPTPHPCGRCISCKEIAEGNSIDVLEIDGASTTGVDDVRELRENVKYVPSRGRYKIYIIDEVHMLSNSAFNALLKTLEEPPAHVIFMFATTEPHKIPTTVLSRCQRFDLRRISLEAIVKQLSHITSQENITISEQGLGWIAKESEGSMRDAQSILDRVISYAGEHVGDEDIVEVLGLVDKNVLVRASQAILGKDAKGCIDIVRDLFHFGYDTRQFYHAFLEHLRNLIIVKISKNPAQLMELSQSECDVLKAQVRDAEVETLQRLFDIWLRAEDEINRSSMPQIVLEMILLKMVYIRRLLPLDDALAKLNDLEKMFSDKRTEGEKRVAGTPPSSPLEYEETQDRENEPSQLKDGIVTLPGRERGESDKKQIWEKLLAFAKVEKPMLAAVLEHGCLLHLDEEKVELGFAPNSIFLESANDTENNKQLKTIFEEFLGRKVQVKISSLGEEGDIKLPVQLGERGKDSEGDREKEALHNPLVNEILCIFDGKIVEVRKKGDEKKVGNVKNLLKSEGNMNKGL